MRMITFVKGLTVALVAFVLFVAGLILTVTLKFDPLATWCGLGGVFLMVAAWLLKEEK